MPGIYHCMSKGTEVCEDVVYLYGLGLSRIVLIYTCYSDIIINRIPFTPKYVLSLGYKLCGHLFIW